MQDISNKTKSVSLFNEEISNQTSSKFKYTHQTWPHVKHVGVWDKFDISLLPCVECSVENNPHPLNHIISTVSFPFLSAPPARPICHVEKWSLIGCNHPAALIWDFEKKRKRKEKIKTYSSGWPPLTHTTKIRKQTKRQNGYLLDNPSNKWQQYQQNILPQK